MASDTTENVFAVCDHLFCYNEFGKQRLSVSDQDASSFALTDAEDILFIENGQFTACRPRR